MNRFRSYLPKIDGSKQQWCDHHSRSSNSATGFGKKERSQNISPWRHRRVQLHRRTPVTNPTCNPQTGKSQYSRGQSTRSLCVLFLYVRPSVQVDFSREYWNQVFEPSIQEFARVSRPKFGFPVADPLIFFMPSRRANSFVFQDLCPSFPLIFVFCVLFYSFCLFCLRVFFLFLSVAPSFLLRYPSFLFIVFPLVPLPFLSFWFRRWNYTVTSVLLCSRSENSRRSVKACSGSCTSSHLQFYLRLLLFSPLSDLYASCVLICSPFEGKAGWLRFSRVVHFPAPKVRVEPRELGTGFSCVFLALT